MPFVCVSVRQKTKDLMEFIQDDDRLREERKKAKKNKDKYTGISGGRGGSMGRFDGGGYSKNHVSCKNDCSEIVTNF